MMTKALLMVAALALAACAQNSGGSGGKGNGAGNGNNPANCQPGDPNCAPVVPGGGGNGDVNALMGSWTSGPLQQEGGITVTLIMNFSAQRLDYTVICAGGGQTASPRISVPIRVTGNTIEVLQAGENNAPFQGQQCQASLGTLQANWSINGNRLTLGDGQGEPLVLTRQ